MKFFSATYTASLLLLFGAAPAFAQHGNHDEKSGGHDSPQGKQNHEQSKSMHESGHQSMQHGQKMHESGQRHQDKAQRHEDNMLSGRHTSPPEHAHGGHSPKESREWQKQRGWEHDNGWHGGKNWKGGRAEHWDNDHRTWAQRGGYGGYYIADYRFGRYFGPAHWFRIRTQPVIYMGYPRFFYGGTSFLMVDPWPEYWADDWYNDDDVYIDYNDGYYLYNRRSPGVGIAVTVLR